MMNSTSHYCKNRTIVKTSRDRDITNLEVTPNTLEMSQQSDGLIVRSGDNTELETQSCNLVITQDTTLFLKELILEGIAGERLVITQVSKG